MIRLTKNTVVLSDAEATDLAQAVMAAHQYMRTHGAGLKASVVVLAANIDSSSGNTDNTDNPADEHVEHEQIDSAQAAHILGCSERNVRYLVNAGRLPGHKVGGRWQFNRDDITVFRDFHTTNIAA